MKNVSLFMLMIILAGCGYKALKSAHTIKDLVKPVEIAVMVPPAQKGLHLAELVTLGVTEGTSTDQTINVTIYEVTTQENASSALRQAAAKQTNIILGPLLASVTRSMSESADIGNMTIFSFSNNPEVVTENVYIFGHSPLLASRTVTKYLLDEGHKNFILFLSDNASDHLVASIEAQAATHGATVKVLRYDSVSIHDKVAQLSEFIDELNESPNITTKPVIYITDNTSKMPRLFDELVKYKIDEKAIVCGDYNIDIDYRKDIDLLFAGSSNYLRSEVSQRVTQKFGIEHLSELEKLAYDMGYITGQAIGDIFDKRTFRKYLDSKVIFPALSGDTRFHSHVAERKYDIIARYGQEYQIISENIAVADD